LQLAIRIGELLTGRGAEVMLTRVSDVFVELSDRAQTANQWNADFFLSVHINAGGGSGLESYIYPGTSGVTAAFQEVIHRQAARVFTAAGLPDRGCKQADYAVLRETDMPAVLMEYGFIDNPRDASFLKIQANRERIAQAAASGVAEAFGLPEPNPVTDEGSNWAREARDWAVFQGITDGARPQDPATREEVWTMLYRALRH